MTYYNQKVIQKEFGNYDLSAWEDDCLACSNEVHNVNEPIPHECYMCAEFSPVVSTYNYFDFFALLGLPIILWVIYLLFKRKRK